MRRKAIALDIDGVCADFTAYVLPIVNSRLGTSFTDNDWINYYGESCFGAESAGILEELVRDPVTYLMAKPIKGAVRAIRTLSEFADIHFVTCRPAGCKAATVAWLNANNFWHDELTVTQGSKADVVRDLGLFAFVDDCADYAQEVAPFVEHSILFNQPWNQGDCFPVIRLRGWTDVLEFLLRRMT